jgi:hypothetical protein
MTQATPAEIMRRLELAYEAAEAALESAQDETAQALEHYKGLCRRAASAPDPDAADAEAGQAYGDYLELRGQIAGYEKAAEEAYTRLEYARQEERDE